MAFPLAMGFFTFYYVREGLGPPCNHQIVPVTMRVAMPGLMEYIPVTGSWV